MTALGQACTRCVKGTAASPNSVAGIGAKEPSERRRGGRTEDNLEA